MSNLDKQTGRMRPYHILLAVRIIILYQLILLFCVHRGLHFFLVLLFAISETSPTSPQSDSYLHHPAPLHPSHLTPSPFLVLLAVLRVHISCCPISFSPFFLSVLSLLRSGLFAPSAPLDDASSNASFSASHQFHLLGFRPFSLVYSILPPYLPPTVFFQARRCTPPLLASSHAPRSST
jgi:hypothetical protein